MAKNKTGKKKEKRKDFQAEPAKAAVTPAAEPMSTDELRKKVLYVALQVAAVGLIMFFMVWGRAYYSQRQFYNEGEAALKAKNYKEAITGYEWAIRMYTPFSGNVEDACEKLWQIGNEYEKMARPDWALIAYRSLRSSIYAIESLYSPYAEWIPKTDEKIAQMLAVTEGKKPPKTTLPPGK